HLISITERIQINHSPVPEPTLIALLNEIAEVTRAWETSPTFFEILTACALLYFEREKVEWVIWETGMGGKLDSTNIVTPVVSAITQIDFDHQEFLGESLLKIGLEKAGIIKQGVPTICGVRDPEVLQAIHDVAKKMKSPWIDTQEIWSTNQGIQNRRQNLEIEGIPFQLSLLGEHQIQNATVAYAILSRILKIPKETIQAGFSKTIWPGRFQILREHPLLVLDGAHNPSSISALVHTWKEAFGELKVQVVFGAMQDKSHLEIIETLMPISKNMILVKPNNPRAIDPQKIASLFQPLPVQIEESLSAYWPQLISSPDPTLITGSLFLVGEALHLQNPSASPSTHHLNEQLKPEPKPQSGEVSA
ncbi:MAG: cyanophycin synthetase, partial [Verrucomicrobiota bacterium]